MHVFHVHGCLDHQQIHDPVAQRGHCHGHGNHRAQWLGGRISRFRCTVFTGGAGIAGQAGRCQQRHHRQDDKSGVAERKQRIPANIPQPLGERRPDHGSDYPTGHYQGKRLGFQVLGQVVGGREAIEVGKRNVDAQCRMADHQRREVLVLHRQVATDARHRQRDRAQHEGALAADTAHQPGDRIGGQHQAEELETIGHGGPRGGRRQRRPDNGRHGHGHDRSRQVDRLRGEIQVRAPRECARHSVCSRLVDGSISELGKMPTGPWSHLPRPEIRTVDSFSG